MNSQRPVLALILTGLAVVAAGCGASHDERSEASPTPIKAHLEPVKLLQDGKPILVYGTVQPRRQSVVSSRATGPVMAVRVQAGDVVAKGQALLEIAPETADGQAAQAKGALSQAQAALALAEKNLRRYEALHEEKAASDLELDMARTQHEQAMGAVKQAEGAVQAASTIAAEAVVRAPFAARVVEKLVDVGDLAAPGRPLVRLESRSGRKIWLTVRETDIRHVHQGQHLKVRMDARPDLGTLDGVVAEIMPAADAATHTFTVKVTLPDADISSGLAGRAEIPGASVDRLVIPSSAVHRRGGLELVVVRDADGTARTRAVTTGNPVGDDRVEVLSGLAEGDQVVVDAPGPVADGTPVEVER